MENPRITAVNKGRTTVDIEVLNVTLHFFIRKRGGKLSFTKGKKDSQVLDPNQLWVPDILFRRAYRQAAAILTPSENKNQQLELF